MFPGIEHFVDQILMHLIDEYPLYVGLGAYILSLIAMSTIALALVLIVSAVWIPFQLSKRIFDYLRP